MNSAENCSTFYNEFWTKENDDKFLMELGFHAFLEGRRLSTNDRDILTKVMDTMNEQKLIRFDYYSCYRRFELAHQRYVTWDWITNCKELVYDKPSNTVTATKEVWSEICKIHTIGHVYMNENEHMWKHLQEIFGPDSARGLEDSQGVKELSYAQRMTERLDALLAEIATDSVKCNGKAAQTEAFNAYVPPDVMSCTKGKGGIISHAAPSVPSMEFNTGGGSNKNGSEYSSVSKRRLNF